MATPAEVVATMQRVIGCAMIATGLAAVVAVAWTALRESMAVSSVDLFVMARLVAYSRGVAFVEGGRLLDFVRLDG